VRTGEVLTEVIARNNAVTFTAFLDQIDTLIPDGTDIHVVLDNGSSHTASGAIRLYFAMMNSAAPGEWTSLGGRAPLRSRSPGQAWWGETRPATALRGLPRRQALLSCSASSGSATGRPIAAAARPSERCRRHAQRPGPCFGMVLPGGHGGGTALDG
jgi:hypothetical protein